MVTPVSTDPDAPPGEVGETVPAAPDGKPFEVVSLAAFTGEDESSDCDVHLAADAGAPHALDPTGGVANARLLDDGAHWLACVVGDVLSVRSTSMSPTGGATPCCPSRPGARDSPTGSSP